MLPLLIRILFRLKLSSNPEPQSMTVFCTYCAIWSTGIKKQQKNVQKAVVVVVVMCLVCWADMVPCSQSKPSWRPSPRTALLALKQQQAVKQFVDHIHFLMTFGLLITVKLFIHQPPICLKSEGKGKHLCREAKQQYFWHLLLKL